MYVSVELLSTWLKATHHDISTVCGETAETEDGDDARNETKRLQGGGQAKNTNADLNGDEDDTCSPATQGSVFIFEATGRDVGVLP